jgi:hypothetical protein
MRFEEDGGARWDLPHRATASRDVALLTPVLAADIETIHDALLRVPSMINTQCGVRDAFPVDRYGSAADLKRRVPVHYHRWRDKDQGGSSRRLQEKKDQVMKRPRLTFVGILALTAAASVAFAQGPPLPSMGGGPNSAASGEAGNVGGGALTSGGDVTVDRGALNSSGNVTVFRGGRTDSSGADHRGSGTVDAGAEAESATASECDQNAMQICRQQWDICSDICVTGDIQSQQTCWTGCVNRYNHCRIASSCR